MPEGISREQRTRDLNTQLRGIEPGICLERARLVTESYRGTEGEPCILRRAKALDHVLSNMTIFILDDEMIVGNHASRQRWAPLFPEAGVFGKKELDLFPFRNVDTLQLSDEDKNELLEQINPYWKNRNTEEIARHYVSDETLKTLAAEHKVFDPMSRTRSGYGHYIPNIEKILLGGFQAVEREARERLATLSPLDPSQTDKALFYKAASTICQAVKKFSTRYAELAETMAGREPNPRRKRELGLIADVCARVPYQPARSFHEALQSYWFTILIDYISQNGSAISGGRFDQYMFPFYKTDLGSGRLTKEEAQELLEALWIKHSDIIKACSFSSAKNNGGFATTIHLNLSGVGKDGKDATNELSYLCLEVERNVFNSEPNVGLRVHTSTPDELLLRAIQILSGKQGGKLPFFNDNAIVPALCGDGVPLDAGRDYGIVGCVEPTPTGNSMGITNACYFNLAKCLELSLNDGRCLLCGEEIGPRTGDARGFVSFPDVKDAFVSQTEHAVAQMICALNSIETVIATYLPHTYSSLLVDGCMERGQDVTAGGADFNYTGVQGIGLADVADSLAAVQKLVFLEKAVSMPDLLDALGVDFEGKESLRQMLIKRGPKYGNDIDEVDSLAQFVAETYCHIVRKAKDPRGGSYRPGLFCLSSNVPFGGSTGALPSGRKARTPLADGGLSPKHGMDTNGPSAVMKSVAKIDHALASNGITLNQKYVPSALRNDEQRKKLTASIRAYFELGGFQIQFNIIDTGTLRRAQEAPEQYRDLVVRVAGYSAFFVDLDRAIQDEIIERTVQRGA